MASSVVIKSYNKGLSIHMDPDVDIEVIKKDLADRFAESASFFKDAKMAISFEDRELDSQTERDLVNIITANSQVNVACIAGKNKITQQLLLNALNQLEYKSEMRKDAVQIVRGPVKDGRVIDIPGDLLIVGDVYPGASVIATGDIFIYGGLYGQAYAGNSGEITNVVAALDMNPEKLRVAGIRYKSAEKPKWSIKNKQIPQPKCARLVGSEIVMDVIDGKYWNKFFEE